MHYYIFFLIADHIEFYAQISTEISFSSCKWYFKTTLLHISYIRIQGNWIYSCDCISKWKSMYKLLQFHNYYECAIIALEGKTSVIRILYTDLKKRNFSNRKITGIVLRHSRERLKNFYSWSRFFLYKIYLCMNWNHNLIHFYIFKNSSECVTLELENLLFQNVIYYILVSRFAIFSSILFLQNIIFIHRLPN